ELGSSSRAAGSVKEPLGAVAGKRGRAATGCDLANAVVAIVGDVDVADPVYDHTAGKVERGRTGRSAGAVEESKVAVASECGGAAPGRDLADARIVIVADVEVAGSVDRGTEGTVEVGGSGRTAGAVHEAAGSISSQSAHDDCLAEQRRSEVGRAHEVGRRSEIRRRIDPGVGCAPGEYERERGAAGACRRGLRERSERLSARASSQRERERLS